MHATALHGISVKELNTTYINDISFVLYSTNFNRGESFEYAFKNVRVMGNFSLPKNCPDLKMIDRLLRDSVRKNGR